MLTPISLPLIFQDPFGSKHYPYVEKPEALSDFSNSNLRAPLKTGFVMRTSEKRDSKAEVKIYRNRSRSYCEERFSLTTLLFHFVAVRNRKQFLEVP